ncbi:MAG: hypothetical protein OET81_12840 [Desulfobacteraceae bacterium]|nr:hypothetical protein [Desulfobacteraceae bacterium]
MDIVIGRTGSVNEDASRRKNPGGVSIRKKKVDRRKNKQDRRKGVRDGVIVALSTKKDRRVEKDRRRKTSY